MKAPSINLTIFTTRVPDCLATIENVIIKFDEFSSMNLNTPALEDECEKELETTKEIEVENVLEIQKQISATETDWAYSSIGEWKITDSLNSEIIIPLSEAVRMCLSFQNGFSTISWPKNLFCTLNFLNTFITSPTRTSSASQTKSISLNNYLRPIDAILCVNEDLILISDRELDAVLPHFWTNKNLENGNKVQLVNFSFLVGRDNTNRIPLSLQFGSIQLDQERLLIC
jgi:hypothetical protein